jgi:hypothetical protein
VGLVAIGLQLEGAVVDVEVVPEAFSEPVEDFTGAVCPLSEADWRPWKYTGGR